MTLFDATPSVPEPTRAPTRAQTGSGRSVANLGIRGVPAAHGGFETFAERFAPWLVERGWRVTVHCQDEADAPEGPSEWRGVRLVRTRVRTGGALGTVVFDWRSILKAVGEENLVLTLGYNTAVFGVLHRLRGVVNVVNMDGLEWQRRKWPWAVRQWFWINEQIAARMSERLIGDHPVIVERLARFAPAERIDMIPYGADAVLEADPAPLAALGLEPGGFVTHIARIERENQTLEIVRAFSRRPRGVRLAVLGRLEPERNPYHAEVAAAAGPEVSFLGAIYEPARVRALRRHALLHYHGHVVGGTNPSLVEALGAGAPILAHDNPFNRWVAGEGQRYFVAEADMEATLSALLGPERAALAAMSAASRRRHAEAFTWEPILGAYETALLRAAPAPAAQG